MKPAIVTSRRGTNLGARLGARAGVRASVRTCVVTLVVATLMSATLVTTGAPKAAADTQIYVVDTISDAPDQGVGNGSCHIAGGGCSLRAALQEADADADESRIEFAIPGAGPHTIELDSSLPMITDPYGGTTIDGYTQPGSAPNDAALGSNADLRIAVRGSGSSGPSGLTITSSGNVVRGLALYDLAGAIRILEPTAMFNIVAGNFVGTNPAGTFTASAFDVLSIGVTVNLNASFNRIGGPALADRNVVSGNAGRGVGFFWDTSFNVVENNVIGLSPTGSPLGNLGHGVDLNYRTHHNRIGSDTAGLGNIISANGGEGVEVSHGEETVQNLVAGNLIGTTLDGTSGNASTGNDRHGVFVEDHANTTTIRDNTIVANGSAVEGGIKLSNFAHHNVVERNRIGVTTNGTPVPNGGTGGFAIKLENAATTNRIGPGNEIIGHWRGVWVASDTSVRNRITRNVIEGQTMLGIDLAPTDSHAGNDPGDADTGANDRQNWPVLKVLTPATVRAYTCSGCTVELFENTTGAGTYGPASEYLASGVGGSDGTVVITIDDTGGARLVTATATDAAGNTSEMSSNRAIPANFRPAASFTSSCDTMTCSFDASASSDVDGSITSWAWEFGDGMSSGAARPPAVEYAVPGTYPVRVTVTDDRGAIGEAVSDITVMPGPNNPLRGRDEFERRIGRGWGRAPRGGRWQPVDDTPVANLGVRDGVGTVVVAEAGGTRGVRLAGTMHRDLSTRVTVATSRTSSRGTQTAFVTSRAVLGAGEYRARVRFVDGAVRVGIVRLDAAGSTTLLAERVVSGVPHVAGFRYSVRFDLAGANPTILATKVWLAGFPEPAGWGVITADGTPGLQRRGASGVGATLGTATTNAPVAFAFDDYTVTSLNRAPVATFAPSCTGLTCTFAGAIVDPDGSVVLVRWNFGDGSTVTGPSSPGHTYAGTGTYPVTLAVRDNFGYETIITQTIDLA